MSDHVSSDYLSVTRSTVTGGAGWYAGANSVDGGSNTGWIFAEQPTFRGTSEGTLNLAGVPIYMDTVLLTGVGALSLIADAPVITGQLNLAGVGVLAFASSLQISASQLALSGIETLGLLPQLAFADVLTFSGAGQLALAGFPLGPRRDITVTVGQARGNNITVKPVRSDP